ncbi:MAG TPA: tetratricopeptide repeat protein [Trueperaceae bacterium]|jgi:tetratricopeptide (TPR) repeat protein
MFPGHTHAHDETPAPPRATRPGARFLAPFVAALALLGAAFAQPPTVLVHQFDSQDLLLGAALASEVADALEESAVVIGPEVAPTAVPPVVVEGGFINPVRVIEPTVMFGPAGADLLQGSTGVDVAVTGYVEERDERLSLFVAVAQDGRLRTGELTADPEHPERLVQLAAAFVGGVLDELDPDGAPHYARSASPPTLTGGFEGPYGDYVRAIALAGAAMQDEALASLREAAGAEGVPERAARVLDDLEAVIEASGEPPADATSAARRALFSMQRATPDIALSRAAFATMAEATGLPSASAWEAALAASVNDRAGAEEAYDRAAYDYGVVARHSFLLSRGEEGDPAAVAALVADPEGSSSAALLAAALAAEFAGDVDGQVAALQALNRSSPFLAYPLEALSYVYFDRGDGRAAAEALAVAVELQPESDLYWTNLGWAYYLVGQLELSEEASLRALELDGTQSVAAYNLGLVRVVTGRLGEAMAPYQQALRFDPEVNDEAIQDLQNALALYPDEPGVDYALGLLLEADGRRQEARDAYRRFLERAGEGQADLVADAEARLVELDKPLPPMEIAGGARLTLGAQGPEATPFHPGDEVHPTFELSTPGDELPTRVQVRAELRRQGEEGDPLVASEAAVEVPPGAVGFVVDGVALALPQDLAEGTYQIEVSAVGGEGQVAETSVELEVAGEPQALRQLIGRNLTMTDLRSGQPLYSVSDLSRAGQLVEVLVAELRYAADAAEEALPTVETGRFQGMSGGELFRSSTAEDVEAFLAYVLASGSRDARFAFVDAYAQWALDGAPETP